MQNRQSPGHTDNRLDWDRFPAAIWRRHRQALRPVTRTDPIRLDQLQGIDRQKQALIDQMYA